ncbi:hypothetical protein AB0F18_21570 [Streptomyces sp. NPDC029216]|uniref:hypothetical protein n=1 Tax=Streptomyces sp. NPDC029216 TaxID=3154701 RepID=UPI0033CE949F
MKALVGRGNPGGGQFRGGREVELLHGHLLLELRPLQAALQSDGLAAGDLVLAGDLKEVETAEFAAVGLVVVSGVATVAKSRAEPWRKAAAPASPLGSGSVQAMRMPLMVREDGPPTAVTLAQAASSRVSPYFFRRPSTP